MPRVHIVGWNPGLNKVALTKALRQSVPAGLKPAKEMTDAVLAGEPVEFEVETGERARAVAAELAGLGAVVELTNDRVP